MKRNNSSAKVDNASFLSGEGDSSIANLIRQQRPKAKLKFAIDDFSVLPFSIQKLNLGTHD